MEGADAIRIETGLPQRYERRLKDVLADEVRVDLLRVLEERPRSLRELAEMFGDTLSAIAGHVFELWKEGSLETKADDSAPLADRRFYLAKTFFDNASWGALSNDERYEEAVRIMEGIIGEAMSALRSGRLASRPEEHLTWTPMVVDQRGWLETTEVLDRAFQEVSSIKERCAERLDGKSSGAMPVIVSIMGYERAGPPPSP